MSRVPSCKRDDAYSPKLMLSCRLARRDFLATGAAAVLGGCRSTLAKSQPLTTIGDAHVHLFNGADLPVRGFFQHVLIPNRLSGLPDIVLALIDMATSVLKKFSKTATEEWTELGAAFVESNEVTAEQFANEIAERAEQEMRAARVHALRGPENNLGDSYHALADRLGVSRSSGPKLNFIEPRWLDDVPRIDRSALADIVRSPQTDTHLKRLDDESFGVRELKAIIAWAFQMRLSRRAHVREYLKATRAPDTQVTLLVNLLVDYDLWLADGPKTGSSHADQVRFWTAYSRSPSAPVRIETFAGYDPLKHAIGKRENQGKSAYFEDLKRWTLAPAEALHGIAGLKLYPPMGFNVSANIPLPAQAGRAAAIVRNLWTSKGWKLDDLPTSLDDALDDLFDFATLHDIPLLAHGRESNQAFEGAEKMTRPRYWRERAESVAKQSGRHPLRACFGHFYARTADRNDVVTILNMNLQRRANIYFDLAFDEEILDPVKGRALLDWIERLCRDTSSKDAAADYFMLGTDWIMLAQIPDADDYVEAFHRAVTKHPFWGGKRDSFMGGNLRRFLKLDPPRRA